MHRTAIVTLTGPSCSGKTVLSSRLHDLGFYAMVSTTTRPMREGEVQDVNYHFTTPAAFEADKAAHRLVESVLYDGNHYGLGVAEIDRASELSLPAASVLEPSGVVRVRDYCREKGYAHIGVFINNPVRVLIDRLLERAVSDTIGLDPAKDAALIARRTATHASRIARVVDFEQKEWVEPALSGAFHYDLVVPEFNPGNEAEVIARIQSMATAAMKAPRPARLRPSGTM